MRIIRNPKQMYARVTALKKRDKRIGLVSTMGALHEGHLSLIRQARKENDFIVVSIFVNPAQFSPKEDFRKYPRNLTLDSKLCREEDVDVIFYPSARDMYPAGNFKTHVEVTGLSDLLCGRWRPGHFRAVTTVVMKLLNIAYPDIVYFGQKDAQQAIIIKKMIEDLNIPVKIKIMPIVRDKDGLAMSSRNSYLDRQERADALVLFKSLKLAKKLIKKGMRSSPGLIREMKKLMNKKKSVKIDYISIVDPSNLTPIRRITNNCLILLAVRIGKTRLIDNIIV